MSHASRCVLRPLTLAISGLLLAACTSTSQQKIAPLAHHDQAQGTLADLENRDIVINAQDLKQASVEDALGNYKDATAQMPNDQSKVDTLKRMADLTAKASEARDLKLNSVPNSAAATTTAERKKINQNIDTMLYSNFMQGMATANSKEKAAAYLDLASSVSGDVDKQKVKVDYDQAIHLYEEVLSNSRNPKERQETYYKLARLYDIAGRNQDSIATLGHLVHEYPSGPYYVEAEFRRGEAYFKLGDDLSAITAYEKVIASPRAGHYRQQARYKLGWAYFKSADYAKALDTFFQVDDGLRHDIASSRGPRQQTFGKLLSDTQRVISLCFMQEDGPSSATAWFKEHGSKPYEADIYQALGKEYLIHNRFQDAADAYQAFVDSHPMDSHAPTFSSNVIKAYEDGGFPDLILPAKEAFIQHYGIGSAYWQQAPISEHNKLMPLLRKHMLDLAQHDHAEAQKTHQTALYLSAVGWYQQYLATDPAPDQAMHNRELMAEALYAAGHYEEAIKEFDKTAYGYNNNPHAIDAAHFELTCYEALLEEHKGQPDSDAIWARSVQASLHYAQAFPADPHAASILADVTDAQLARKDTPAAVKTARLIVQLQPPPQPRQMLAAWEVIANGEFDLDQAQAAEHDYARVLAFDSPLLSDSDRAMYQERQAAAIYKQAENLRDQHDVERAVQAFMRVGEVVPNSRLHPIAEFDAATLLLNTQQYTRAIDILEAFARQFPNHPLNQTLPEKLGLAYEKTGHNQAASVQFELIANRQMNSDPALAREALAHAANLADKAHEADRSAQLNEKFLRHFQSPVADVAEVQYHLLQYYQQRLDATQSDRLLHDLIETDAHAGAERSARTRYLAAMATFQLAQPDFDAFVNIPLKQPLNVALTDKKAHMQKALDDYKQVLSYNIAEYTSAANYQIATIYHQLASDLMASERPANLSSLELEQYNILLEEQADPFDDKAISLYVANTDLVKQNIYDAWVQKSFSALAKLSPGRYDRHEQLEPVLTSVF